MRREEVLSLLKAHRADIQQRFAVRHLAIFGSTARDDARDDSDVDVLVEFEGPASLDGYMGLKSFLEDILLCPVDLITNTGLKPRARPNVEKDLIHVA